MKFILAAIFAAAVSALKVDRTHGDITMGCARDADCPTFEYACTGYGALNFATYWKHCQLK